MSPFLVASLVLGLLLLGGGATVYLQRGLRNKNPGNVRLTEQGWLGKVPNSQNTDGEFEQFVEMHYGVRAVVRILRSYFAREFKTPRDIATRWSSTDQGAYVQNLAAATKTDPDSPLNLNDDNVLFAVVRAILRQEVGAVPALTITDAVVWEAMV